MVAPSPATVPHHIAIVMDGNGRWAAKRFLPRLAGHRQGVVVLKRCVKACIARGVRVLTVFAFSSENWSRPEEEVSGLMELLVTSLAGEVIDLQENGVRLYFVGDRLALSTKIQAALAQAEGRTRENTRFILNVCFNYGGRWDIVQAAHKILTSGQDFTQSGFDRALALAHVPDPDLFIRSGGEMRLSNFLLWQAAYAELYFSHRLWPEFDEAELDASIAAFAQRERRFGQVPEQALSKAIPINPKVNTCLSNG